MGFDIPEPFKWDESFQVFYANLDEEHRGLFDAIFKLVESPASEDAKNNLYSKCDAHFKTEEGMMSAAKYGDYETHKGIHDKFLGDLKGVALPLTNDGAHWAKDWLVNHIKGTDFKYKGKLS